MSNHRILKVTHPNSSLQYLFSKKLGISKVLAQILINRGIRDVEEARGFLHGTLNHLLDPYTFAHMQRAVALIRKAARDKQAVMVFGDYDVDGITAVALLQNTLLAQGISCSHYIPHRIREGYGLNRQVVNIVKQKNIKLLITADSGTNSYAAIEELRRHNVEVIVTDHHEPVDERLPPASAMINPKVKGCTYAFRELAGVGVAYKLCQALTGDLLEEDLDLVSLGTIADVVPLTGENRIIASEGLRRLSQTKKAGLNALIERAGIKNRILDATSVSFILGPRLNASGRMDTAEIALSLLLTTEEDEAARLAQAMEAFNRQRQRVENSILEEAQALIDKEINFKEHKIIVIAKEDWHQGVLGIVASKLADKFYRPTILISKASRLCKGSGRSIKSFHLFQALLECKDFLEAFGGHSHAAGILITKENIDDFKHKINQLAKEKLQLEDLIPTLEVDMEVGLADVTEDLVQEMEILQPYGTGNPQPLFYTCGLALKGQPQVLSKYTLKFWVTDGRATYQAIGFGMAGFRESLINAKGFDLVYSPQLDSWQGAGTIILEVRDIFIR